MTPTYIVWHTAAHGNSQGGDYDTSVEQIDFWHRSKGWGGIGYHFVVRKSGTIENGRLPSQQGAHVLGLNHRSLGICFSGHGDLKPHTPEQRAAGLELTRRMMNQFRIPASNVIGHREINLLVDRGLLAAEFRTSKTCPGILVSMTEVRGQLGEVQIVTPAGPRIRYRSSRPTAIDEIALVEDYQEFLRQHGLYGGTADGWAGQKTSDATHSLVGTYLSGDPRKDIP